MTPVLSLPYSPGQLVPRSNGSMSIQAKPLYSSPLFFPGFFTNFDGKIISQISRRIGISKRFSPMLGFGYTKSDMLLNLVCSFQGMENPDISEEGGGYLPSEVWELLPIDKKTDQRGRINAKDENTGKDARVYVSDEFHELEMCGTNYLLPVSKFREVRKSRYKDQAGEPLTIQPHGDIWMGTANKNKFVKVFVRKSKATKQ